MGRDYFVFLWDHICLCDVVELGLIGKIHLAVRESCITPVITFEEKVGFVVPVER